MYSDGSWHYLSAVRSPSGLEMSVDNVNVGQGQTLKPSELTLGREKFKGCIANLYTRRLDPSFLPADLSSLSQTGDVVLGMCRLNPSSQAMTLPAPLLQRPQRHKTIRAQSATKASQCRRHPAQHGQYRLSEPHSWLSYNIPPEDVNYRPHFSLEVRTMSSKGLLLHVSGKGDISLLALFMANGKIKLSLGQNRIIQHKKKSNDGNWHRVVFSVERNTFHLLVDGIRVTDGVLSNDEGSSLDLHNPVYLGGVPKHKTSNGHLIPKESVIGCIRDFKLNEVLVGEPVASRGVSPCLDRLSEIGTYFGGNGGHIVLDKYFTVGSRFELAFELRPQHLTGLLFHVQSHKTSLNVFLRDNKVGVNVNDGSGAVSVSVIPHQNLCDGNFHAVTVSKQHKVIKLVVDSVSEQKAGSSSSASYSTTLDSLYIGGISGTTKRNSVPVSSWFVGCLRNVRVNGRPVDFEAASSVVGPVSVNKCPAD
uniref:laminin subunit alpha-3 n=1 Tax=Centroberyx gerrardi TaxID=166262 RepID=UPI003AAC4457